MAVTPPPLITTDVSDPPYRGQPQAVFSPKMDSFLASFNPFKIALNTLAGWMQTVSNLVEGWANDAGASATAANAHKMAAYDSEINAASSAASALLVAGTSATSASSITPTRGSVSFDLSQTGKTFVVGQFVTISDSTTPAIKYMLGAITAFNAGTGAMTVDVISFVGASYGTDWVIAASAPIPTLFSPVVNVTGTSQAMVSWVPYLFSNTGSQSTGTLPASISAGERFRLDNATGRTDLTIARNGHKIMGLSEDMRLTRQSSITLEYIDATLGLRIVQ